MNMDGQVTGDDYTLVDSNLNTTPPTGLEWRKGDANRDFIVTGDDYAVIDSHMGQGVGNPFIGAGITPSSLSMVPEPTLGAAALALLLPRRRRSR
jgi:hypothetical protein